MSGDDLAIWAVIVPNDLVRPFPLCGPHSAALLADYERLNREGEAKGSRVALAPFHKPEGGAVHVSFPPGARCASCFGDWPADFPDPINSRAPGGRQ